MNCKNCGTELIIVPPEQVLCDWCLKLSGGRSRRIKQSRYKVSTRLGGIETTTKSEAIQIAKKEGKDGSSVWVRDLITGEVIWTNRDLN